MQITLPSTSAPSAVALWISQLPTILDVYPFPHQIWSLASTAKVSPYTNKINSALICHVYNPLNSPISGHSQHFLPNLPPFTVSLSPFIIYSSPTRSFHNPLPPSTAQPFDCSHWPHFAFSSILYFAFPSDCRISTPSPLSLSDYFHPSLPT